MMLGSRSTYALGALGGHEGRPLAAGDELAVGVAASGEVGRSVPEELRPAMPTELDIRMATWSPNLDGPTFAPEVFRSAWFCMRP